MNGSALLRLGLAASRPSTASIATSAVCREERAGKYYPTRYRTNPLTYEMAFPPPMIGTAKSWLSWHNADLEDTRDKNYSRPAKFLLEDMLIRKFLDGTWYPCLPMEMVIKRNGNLLRICGYIHNSMPPRKIYWLIGYTEEILSRLLKQPVRMELQALRGKKDHVFIYI